MADTRTISIRDFRENLTQLLKEAQKDNIHFVVMRHSVPIAHVVPVSAEERSVEMLAAKIAQARKDAEEGRVYTPEEVLAMIGHHAHRIHRNGGKRSAKSSSRDRAQNHQKNAVVRRPRTSASLRKEVS